MKAERERVVLIVDDEEEVREALASLLRREGYTVHLAESAEEGMQILQREPVKLILSDYNMPGLNGVDFLKRVRDQHPHVVRIMITGDPDPQVIIRSINEGEIYRFIKKPWDNISVRVMVYFAFETIQLEQENRRLAAALRRQMDFMRKLSREFPYLDALSRDQDAEMALAESELVRPIPPEDRGT